MAVPEIQGVLTVLRTLAQFKLLKVDAQGQVTVKITVGDVSFEVALDVEAISKFEGKP
jgi:hypothetical protein